MILVLKMTKKYHITWYWCQNIRDTMAGGRKGKNIRAGVSPPPFRAMPERKHFFSQEGFPKSREMAVVNNIGTIFTMFCTFLSFLVKSDNIAVVRFVILRWPATHSSAIDACYNWLPQSLCRWCSAPCTHVSVSSQCIHCTHCYAHCRIHNVRNNILIFSLHSLYSVHIANWIQGQ